MNNYQEDIEKYTSWYGKPFKEDKNGTLYFNDSHCPKCGGKGVIPCYDYYESGVCFKCGGSGIVDKPEIIKLYTPEYEKKLEARREKVWKKRMAKLEEEAESKRQEWLQENQFTSDGDTFLFLGNTFERKDEIKSLGALFNAPLGWHIDHEVDGFPMLKVNINDIAESTYYGYSINVDLKDAKAKAWKELNQEPESQWFGQVGDKVEMKVKYVYTFSWHTTYSYGYFEEVMYRHIFKDDEGHVFTWKTKNIIDADYGTDIILKGTIKEHSEYKDEKQTVLTRCKVFSVD